jgi:dihydroorotate dehydrogenase (fumarate)
MIEQMESWLERNGFSSIGEIIGKLTQEKIADPALFERAQFMKYFSSSG